VTRGKVAQFAAVLTLFAIGGCSDDSSVGVVAGSSPTASAGASQTSVTAATTNEQAAASADLSMFGAGIKNFTVEVDLKTSDIGFLMDTAPFFATGTLVSAQPGPVRVGGTVRLACEVAPGTTVAGDCSRATTTRGVVLRFALGESRRLRSAGSLPPLTETVDVEFPNGAYSIESNQREVDKAIADVVAQAPVGTRFALFFGPSNFGMTYQVAGSASWGWIDASQHVHALPAAREEPWIDGSSTLASILLQIDARSAR
jgi:hypothetical protein